MRREFIQELRGDSRREAIDIYDHIDLKEPNEACLARCIAILYLIIVSIILIINFSIISWRKNFI